MEFIFIILSWLILLVPGFDDSVPPTEDKIFKIETSPDIVQSIKTKSDEPLDFWGFDIKLKQNSSAILNIKIPKNLPIPASFTGSWNYDIKPLVLADGTELGYDIIGDPCYSHYRIPIKDKTNVEIAYTVILTGTWQLYSPIQFDVDNPCYNKVFYEQPLESPLKQFKSGISYREIQCKDEFELVVKTTNGHPACVKSHSVGKLIERWWATTNKISELVNPEKYLITKDDKTFQIQYSLKGATLDEMINDDDSNSIHVRLNNAVGGELVISIPRGLVDAEIGKSGIDDVFFILIGGREYLYGEKSNENERTLTILFPRGAQDIEIIGTNWI